MKVGIIGLGDIAKKAYLPVLSEKEGIELVLCTRNEETLTRLSNKYRIQETAKNIDELLSKKIQQQRGILKSRKSCFKMGFIHTLISPYQ